VTPVTIASGASRGSHAQPTMPVRVHVPGRALVCTRVGALHRNGVWSCLAPLVVPGL
jgi:hypothetical protein